MNIPLCVRCQKRPATILITRSDSKAQIGICPQCAREIGFNPGNPMEIFEKLGISEEDFKKLSGDFSNMLASFAEQAEDGQDDDETADGTPDAPDARTPLLDLSKFFSMFGGNENDESDGTVPQAREQAKKKSAEDGGRKENRKLLRNFCRDLTARARAGELDAVIGRDRELDRVIQILCRRQKNNPCLIGEPGVGKTAIAEALAQRIAAGQVPYRLKNAEIMLLDLTALVAGTQFRGQFEARMLGLINEVRAAGNIILVIDEVHNIVGAGDAEGSMNAANILKPALSRGEIQVIGATTMKEYRKYIEKDSALERRFQPVLVDEPSVEDTVQVLRGIKGYYEKYHGIRIPNSVLDEAVRLSERYITDRFLPDKAIDLVDEAASHLSLSSPVINELRSVREQMKQAREALEQIEQESEFSENEEHYRRIEERYRRIADLKTQVMQLEAREGELAAEAEKVCMTVDDLAHVIEVWTGVAASSISQNDFEKLNGLKERLCRQIIGQDEAVEAVCAAVRRKRTGVSLRHTPVSFIFAGPTGVGKTELVRVLARELFGQPDALIRFDMSEFMEKHAVSRLVGAPPGYVGYDEAGQLTEKIRRHPYSVVLFDEIEKAHPDVMNILLQILDDGRLTDASGRTVDFGNAILVMTTNAGSENATTVAGFSESRAVHDREKTERALSRFLRPEFLNRVDETITFRRLCREDFSAIARIRLEELRQALAEKGMDLICEDNVYEYVAGGSYSEKYGARNMRRFIQKNIEDKIAEEMVNRYREPFAAVHLSVADDRLLVRCF